MLLNDPGQARGWIRHTAASQTSILEHKETQGRKAVQDSFVAIFRLQNRHKHREVADSYRTCYGSSLQLEESENQADKEKMKLGGPALGPPAAQ